MDKVDITVIGAGVVGLAIASRLSASGKYQVALLDKNSSFGQETSSRNSEVIHSGIYYPKNSLKTSLCVRGNALLYEYCIRHSIAHRNCGKIVVASNKDESAQLDGLMKNGIENGVSGLEPLSHVRLNKLEPRIKALDGLSVPSTGIIDSHKLMASLFLEFKTSGGIAAFGSEVIKIEKSASGGYIVTSGKEGYKFISDIVINSAGLHSEKIAQLAGIDTAGSKYKIHYCKGDYFRIKPKFNIKRLIYPVPAPAVHNLGIHITLDLAGGMRLGPSAYYVNALDYTFGPADIDEFYLPAKLFLPDLTKDDLYPDTSGIRPKLQGPGEPFRDFVIHHESDKGLKGFINLIGIESPGLTSCLAVAESIENIVTTI